MTVTEKFEQLREEVKFLHKKLDAIISFLGAPQVVLVPSEEDSDPAGPGRPGRKVVVTAVDADYDGTYSEMTEFASASEASVAMGVASNALGRLLRATPGLPVKLRKVTFQYLDEWEKSARD